jgi:hypothetical protein
MTPFIGQMPMKFRKGVGLYATVADCEKSILLLASPPSVEQSSLAGWWCSPDFSPPSHEGMKFNGDFRKFGIGLTRQFATARCREVARKPRTVGILCVLCCIPAQDAGKRNTAPVPNSPHRHRV